MRGLTVSPVSGSDAVDMVKRQPVLREVQLHPYRTCCEPPGAEHSSFMLPLHVVHFTSMLSHSLMALCVCVCLCVMEGKEEVCLRLRLCACLWRRGCACFYEEGRGGGAGGVGRRLKWVLSLGAAMRSLRSSRYMEP